jgi:Aminoglycoside adenylyltransferase, C-terminal domain
VNVRPDQVPEPARTAWLRLRDGLQEILGGDLVAMWAHGGTLASTQPRQADLDTYVILARWPDEATVLRILHLQEAIEGDLAVEWDAWFITADDARGSTPPEHAFRQDRIDQSWAVQRAHWLAGRYWSLHGPPPDGMVLTPTMAEIEADLGEELEHLERHVDAGDTDPYEATYAVLNGSRILHTLKTGDAAVSKGEAGTWALEHLPDRWHPLLEAALSNYDGLPNPDDARLLATGMAPFVAMVRGELQG